MSSLLRSKIQSLICEAIDAKRRETVVIKLEGALELAAQYGLEEGVPMHQWVYEVAGLTEEIRNGARIQPKLEQIQEVPSK